MTSCRINDELRAADRARIEPRGFKRDKAILLAPENERRHGDAGGVLRHEIIFRYLETAKCRLTRALHAREIPVTVDHPVIDDCLAHDRVIETFNHEHARRNVKKYQVENRNSREAEGERNVFALTDRHADGVNQDKLCYAPGI